MNDLVTDVKSLELETLQNLKSSKASNTLRAYKTDYKDFAQNITAMAEGGASDAVTLTAGQFLSKPKVAVHKSASSTHHNTAHQSKKPQGTSPAQYKKQSHKPSQKSPRVQTQLVPKGAQNNDRVSTIIDFITKRGSASTGDVAALITGCSSKTLQRDLTKLVTEGILKKEGEKRWTRYSLV